MSIDDSRFLNANPFEIFNEWFIEAKNTEINDPDAIALATVNKEGFPSVRMVLLKEYNKDGFTVFSVSLDQKLELWEAAIEKDRLTWPFHVSDLNGWYSSAAKQYGVESIPSTFLLDKGNKIAAYNLRGEALTQKVKELLNE